MGAVAVKLLQPLPTPKYTKDLPGLFFINCDATKSKIPAIFHEWNGPNGEKAHFTILYSGTTNEDLGEYNQDFIVIKDTLRVNIILFDYCGFGLHETKEKFEKFTEKTLMDNLESVFHYLTKTKNIPPSRIILMARGLGSGPIVQLCSDLCAFKKRTNRKKTKKMALPSSLSDDEIASGSLLSTSSSSSMPSVASSPLMGSGGSSNSVAALVLTSPMSSVAALFPQGEKPSGNIFNNAKKVETVDCPVLLAHGEQDKTIPINHSQILKKSVPNLWRYLELEGARHYDVATNDDFLDAFIEFLKELAPNADAHKIDAKPKPMIYQTPEEVIKAWLKPLGLEKYAQGFVMNGYMDMMSLYQLDKGTLTAIGISNTSEQNTVLADIGKKRIALTLESYIISWKQVRRRDVSRKTHTYETFSASYRGEQVMVTTFSPLHFETSAFVSQALKLLQLKHQNISAPTRVSIDDNILALIFPKLEGRTLEDILLHEPKKLPDVTKFSVAHKIAIGLEYLHSQTPPKYHTHLSSRQIFLNDKSDPCIAGLSHLLSLTANNHLPNDFNPDSMLTAKPSLAEKLDCYSFGVILCELAYFNEQNTYSPMRLREIILQIQSIVLSPRVVDKPTKGRKSSAQTSDDSNESSNDANSSEDTEQPSTPTPKSRSRGVRSSDADLLSDSSSKKGANMDGVSSDDDADYDTSDNSPREGDSSENLAPTDQTPAEESESASVPALSTSDVENSSPHGTSDLAGPSEQSSTPTSPSISKKQKGSKPPVENLPTFAKSVTPLIGRCLHVNPDNRPTMKEILEELAKLVTEVDGKKKLRTQRRGSEGELNKRGEKEISASADRVDKRRSPREEKPPLRQSRSLKNVRQPHNHIRVASAPKGSPDKRAIKLSKFSDQVLQNPTHQSTPEFGKSAQTERDKVIKFEKQSATVAALTSPRTAEGKAKKKERENVKKIERLEKKRAKAFKKEEKGRARELKRRQTTDSKERTNVRVRTPKSSDSSTVVSVSAPPEQTQPQSTLTQSDDTKQSKVLKKQ